MTTGTKSAGHLRRAATKLVVIGLSFGAATSVAAQTLVTMHAEDGGIVHADAYGAGSHAVVLAPGGRFQRGSWRDQAQELVKAGFRVLAIDFRGRGGSRGPDSDIREEDYRFDILAAVRHLRQTGAKSVSVVGASIGGWAAAEASIAADSSEIDALVLLAASPVDRPERIKGAKLFITTRDDTNGSGRYRLNWIREQFAQTSDPKELVVLDGAAHAQFIFETPQGDTLMREIIRFLDARRESR